MQQGTAAFRAAILKSPQAVRSKVEVWSQPTASSQAAFLALLGHVQTGRLTDDETRVTRRQCSLVIANDTGGLVPNTAADLLHPMAGNELRLFRGLLLAGASSPEYIPMGVYRISKPTITQDDHGLLIAVTGYDRMYAIQRARWLDSYTFAAGNLASGLQTAMATRFPGLTYNFSDSGFSGAQVVWGLDPSNNDPSKDFTTAAQSAGQELFFDAQGIAVLRTIPDPTTLPAQFAWSAGGLCRAQKVARDLDESRAYNTVVVTGAGPGSGGPWRSVAQIVPAPSVVIPYFFSSPLITSQAMNDATASSLLLRVQHAIEDVTIDTVPDPQANAGDIAALTFPAVAAVGNYALQSAQTDLAASGVQSIVFRPSQGTS